METVPKNLISQIDPELGKLLVVETQYQADTINLIPSENVASPAVRAALSSALTNKYAEGYPGKRYYAGNTTIDQVEQLAIERAKALFHAEHANVQPYSGSPANLAVYSALLEFGDTVLAMNLAHGGHLTHGASVSFPGKAYNFVHYGVSKETEQIDYDELEKLAQEHKPKLIVSGATAYPRTIDFSRIQQVAEAVGAYHMADISHIAGLIVGGVHPSPLPMADVVTTTTHKSLRGPRGAIILCKISLSAVIDKAVFPGLQGGPHENTIAAMAVALHEAAQPAFNAYTTQIVRNAQALADELITLGYRLVSGGTDNHLLLVDLTDHQISGKEAALRLEAAGIICNKNMIPYDTGTPFNPSGIRLGTPAMTTRGFTEAEFRQTAHLIDLALQGQDVSAEVRQLALLAC